MADETHLESPSTPGTALCGVMLPWDTRDNIAPEDENPTCKLCTKLAALATAVEDAPPPPAAEPAAVITVVVRGVKVVRDITPETTSIDIGIEALMLALVALENPAVDAVLAAYGFEVQAHDGTQVFP